MTAQTAQTAQTALADLDGVDESVDDPVLVEEGWYASCDGAEVAYPRAASAIEAAEQYVEDGDWGESDETRFVTIYTYRKVATRPIGRASHKVAIEPDEPQCEDGHEHSWTAPWSVVGGDKKNPGVRGNGAGLIYRRVCAHCGAHRVTNTWASDRTDGEQGLTVRRYERGDSDS